MQKPIRLLECGCCGQFHPEDSWQPGGALNYKNDCRYDANRFNSDEDFTARTGLPAVEVWLDEQGEMSEQSDDVTDLLRQEGESLTDYTLRWLQGRI